MIDRRELLQSVAVGAGALLLGFRIGEAQEAAPAILSPNAWVRIESGGRIVLMVGKSEMGQGVRTALATLLAEELDVDLDRVEVVQASPGPDFQRLGTGGSGSVMGSWDPLRQAGAAAREMLLAAAAARWRVKVETCWTDRGTVRDLSGRLLLYSDLAAEANRLPVPENPRLKGASEYRKIGRHQPRIDGPDIVRGRAVFGADVRLPGMVFAVIARAPTLGGTVRSFDAGSALAVPGVRACFQVPSGVAVVADSTWAAIRGRSALTVAWQPGPGAGFDSEAFIRQLAERSQRPGVTTRKDGRGREALAAAASTAEALYLYPFSAHGALEPVNATARMRPGGCEIWTPTQTPNAVQHFVAEALGIEDDAVVVHVTLLGGGFGRRLGWDFDVEAVEIARRLEAPVQLVWTREDDLAHGFFQAASAHRLFAGFDPGGRLVAWEHRKVSTPHNARREPTPEELSDPETLASWSWGVPDTPYAIAHLETTYEPVAAPVPIGPWRAVFSPSSVFARESFLDEVAVRLRRDPLELRLELLGAGDSAVPQVIESGGNRIDRGRLRTVLELAARKAGWHTPAPAGRARGIACNRFRTETYVAYVVEVSLRPDAPPAELPFALERVVAAVDCGVVIDPDGVEQQVESGILWSLSNLLGGTTFENGRALNRNFDTFRIATLAETPTIEIQIVRGASDRPHGLGEPTVCPLAPAVTSALARLTGKRFRRLPLASGDFS